MRIDVLGNVPQYDTDYTPLMNAGPSQAIGAIYDQKNKWTHGANRVNPVMIAGRFAFLTLVKINLWGMASNFNLAWARSSDIKQKWINAWYNLGGIFSELQDAVVRGRDKRAFGLKLAPQNIQDAYKEATGQNISGASGIGEAATLAATLTAASGIIVSLGGLIAIVLRALGKDGAIDKDTEWSQEFADKYLRTISPGIVPTGPTPALPGPNTTLGTNLKTIVLIGIAAVTLTALASGWGGTKSKNESQ